MAETQSKSMPANLLTSMIPENEPARGGALLCVCSCQVNVNQPSRMASDINDTFLTRAGWGDPDYGYFWDIWANVKVLRGLRKGIYGAHVSLHCQQNCALLLPSVDELRELQEQIVFVVQNECLEESREGLNDLRLRFLLSYNELFYRTMEAAARHQ